ALTFQNHTDCPLTDFGGKTSIFSHPVYLFLRKFSLQDSRGGSPYINQTINGRKRRVWLASSLDQFADRFLGGRK
ncbi:hypothetical protein NLO37_11640, partial [Escherichia coli]|nr:hypothetical protein [Escherichia coli]